MATQHMAKTSLARVQTVAFLILVALGLVMGVMATATPAKAAGIYTDPQGRFAIAIGDGWRQRQPDTRSVAALWAYGNNEAIFNIVAETVPSGMTAIEYAQANVPAVAKSNGYREIRRDFITAADQQAPLLDYTVLDENGDRQRVQQVFVTDGKRTGYVLTLRTYAEDASFFSDQVSTMIYTFTL